MFCSDLVDNWASQVFDELNVEDDIGVGRDDRGSAARAVGPVGWAVKLGFNALSEVHEGYIPAFDYLSNVNSEIKA